MRTLLSVLKVFSYSTTNSLIKGPGTWIVCLLFVSPWQRYSRCWICTYNYVTIHNLAQIWTATSVQQSNHYSNTNYRIAGHFRCMGFVVYFLLSYISINQCVTHAQVSNLMYTDLHAGSYTCMYNINELQQHWIRIEKKKRFQSGKWWSPCMQVQLAHCNSSYSYNNYTEWCYTKALTDVAYKLQHHNYCEQLRL